MLLLDIHRTFRKTSKKINIIKSSKSRILFCVLQLQYTHILFLKLFSIEGYYKILTIVPSVCLRSVTQSCPTLCDLWTVARQTPLSMGLSSQEYWSGLPCPPQGIFLTQESNPYLPCLLH